MERPSKGKSDEAIGVADRFVFPFAVCIVSASFAKPDSSKQFLRLVHKGKSKRLIEE